MDRAYARLGISSRGLLLSLARSVSLVALTVPCAVLAQEETTLPEVRVIAPTPIPASPRRPTRPVARPSRPAPAPATRQTRTQTQAPTRAPTPAPAPVPAPVVASEPGVIDRDKVPSPV